MSGPAFGICSVCGALVWSCRLTYGPGTAAYHGDIQTGRKTCSGSDRPFALYGCKEETAKQRRKRLTAAISREKVTT
jgi:hypothetical protein